MRAMAFLSLLLAASLVQAAPAPEQVPAQFVVEPDATRAHSAAGMPDFAGLAVPVALSLLPAAEVEAAQLQAISDWNRSSGRPLHSGIVRVFSQAIRFDLGAESRLALAELQAPQRFASGWLVAIDNGRTLYTTSVRVEGAWRLRLKLAGVKLPEGAKLWVAGHAGSEGRAFGAELVGPDRSLWTPSVAGEQIRLVVSLPGAMPDARFNLVAVGEQFRLAGDGTVLTPDSVLVDLSCRQDAWCHDEDDWAQIGIARSAVALLNYVENGALRQCSGGLVADSDPDSAVPYLITANHCIEDQKTASSVEVWWDYATGACGGAAPDPETLPISLGATLLATGERGDFTLLQLSDAPGSRWFLGWDRRPEATAEGTLLHRISHPRGAPQSYSSSMAGGSEFTCGSWPPRQFIYQTQLSGLVTGGSSGSPVLSEDALLLGQASGLCGSNAGQTCNLDNALVDGALRTYWPEVAPWLAPACTYQLQEPASGSQWPRGSEHEIRWSSSGYGCGEAVKLRLLRDGKRVGVISAGAPNSGSHRMAHTARADSRFQLCDRAGRCAG